MAKAKTDVERCKACGLCMHNCKKGALTMTDHINSRGYKTILLDEETCIGCGICYTVCPDGVFEIVE